MTMSPDPPNRARPAGPDQVDGSQDGQPPALPSTLRDDLAAVGIAVTTDPDLLAGHCIDWTGRWSGPALAAVRPTTTEQVTAVLVAARSAGVAVQVQGGNTGLVGGSVPDRPALLLITTGLDRIDPVDTVERTVVVGAGVTAAALAAHARAAGLHFGVDLAARDSATVGGMVATNAGGMGVCAFGMMREQVRGLKAVLADGRVVNTLGRPRKDNCGYDLTALMAGSEGTLGVITEVEIALHAQPRESSVALLAVADLAEAVRLTRRVQSGEAMLLGAEVVDAAGVSRAAQALGQPDPLPGGAPWLLLLEVADGGTAAGFEPVADQVVAVATSPADRQRLWALRERQTELYATLPGLQKLDVSVRLADLDAAVSAIRAVVGVAEPGPVGDCWARTGRGTPRRGRWGGPPLGRDLRPRPRRQPARPAGRGGRGRRRPGPPDGCRARWKHQCRARHRPAEGGPAAPGPVHRADRLDAPDQGHGRPRWAAQPRRAHRPCAALSQRHAAPARTRPPAMPHSARPAGRAGMLGPVSGRPLVIAHRGASAERAEHTLAAYELAIEQGADGLECDVRLTADGHLVCVHDRRIDRTSDGWGVVSTKTLADLRRHDFGSWAEQGGPRPTRRPLRERRLADRRLESWPGEDVLSDPSGGILTLPTLLDLVTSSPRPILLAIETKHPTRYAGWVEQAVVAQLRRFGLANPARQGPHPVRVMSFSAQAVRRFGALAPGVPRVFLMDRVPLRMRAGDLPFGATIAGPDIAILRAHPSYAARVRRLGSQLYVWTVDEPEDVELCRELGVTAVITNRPGDVSAAVRRT